MEECQICHNETVKNAFLHCNRFHSWQGNKNVMVQAPCVMYRKDLIFKQTTPQASEVGLIKE